MVINITSVALNFGLLLDKANNVPAISAAKNAMLIVRTTPILVVFFMAEYLPRNTRKVEGKEYKTSWWEWGKKEGGK